ncbi:MAG: nitrogen fixation protein NifQ [Methylococcaceae bacterium]
MSPVAKLQDDLECVYAGLISEPFATPNHEWLTCMIASWKLGKGILPDCLGMEPEQFRELAKRYFSGCDLPEQAPSGCRQDFSRMLEKDDLVNLLKMYSQTDAAGTDWIIAVIVAGCLGSDHLWQDLGLWSRSQLSEMLHYNFPELAARNDKDMKWKKFLYKQLCEAEGLYLCRAPSCDVCIDYGKCYGSEE